MLLIEGEVLRSSRPVHSMTKCQLCSKAGECMSSTDDMTNVVFHRRCLYLPQAPHLHLGTVQDLLYNDPCKNGFNPHRVCK